MTTYYFGNIEFGRFSPEEGEDSTPLAIIHNINEVKEFDRAADAWSYWEGSSSESYVSLDAVDENNVQYELVFKQHK
jgi:hypothetical protein